MKMLKNNQKRIFLQARAIFDNQSDCNEELSFKSGDILTVVEKDVNGLTGWWMCYLKEKLGIAPGNRLKVIQVATPDTEHSKQVIAKEIELNYHYIHYSKFNSYNITQKID